MTIEIIIGKIEGNNVIACRPSRKNICDPEISRNPKEAKRTGGKGLKNFINNILSASSETIFQINKYLQTIMAIEDTSFTPIDKDRIKWFKYWTSKAFDLYGDRAGIMIKS